MNIIYMHSHDTGRYIEPYGYAVKTPHLMKLASEGVLFRNAFCASPTCSPSRSALLTGEFPHSNGMVGLAHWGFAIDDMDKHLVAFLKQHGFETALSGIQHEARESSAIGYDHILNSDKISQDPNRWQHWELGNALAAADFIKAERDQPFFLSYGMVQTHRPFPKPAAHLNPDMMNVLPNVFDQKNLREDMAGLVTSVENVDQCVGTILSAVRDAGIEDQTLIVFTTDHGLPFPGMKCSLTDDGLGVSFIMKLPGMKRGKVIDGLVSQLDFFPTVAELLEVEAPDRLQGTSLLPLIHGECKSVRSSIFAEMNYHLYYEPMRCIRTERYKLTKSFQTELRVEHIGGDGGPGEDFVTTHGALDEPREEEKLVDLYLDPMEKINRRSDPRYREIGDQLLDQLSQWMKATNDPLIQGEVPAPPGAKVLKR